MASRPTIYIPNLDGRDRLAALMESLRAQTRPAGVVVVDNGSTDGSQELLRADFPEVELIELGENAGFGPALNRAVAATAGDPVVLVNNDVVCEPRFLEALLEPAAAGAEMVAGVLLTERDPGLIDSAGVIADRTLMGFDYLNGEPREAAAAAPAPLGPTGGAALYSRAAFDAVGGFDERIFLYYEDLDLALRLRAGGALCELAPGAAAVHAYSQTLGAASGAKYARTGWSPRLHAAPLRGDEPAARRHARARRRGRDLRRAAARGPDREGARRPPAGLARRARTAAPAGGHGGPPGPQPARGLGAAPSQARAALRSPPPASRRRSLRSSGRRRSPSSLPFAVAAKRRWATAPRQGARPRPRRSGGSSVAGMNLI